MSTGSPPPPHDPPAGSGAPADPPGGAQPTGPTSYETPGYEPVFDSTARPADSGQSGQPAPGYPPPSTPPEFQQPQAGYPSQPGQPQVEYPPQPGQTPPTSGYPQQNLLPQDVKPGRSRKPLLIGLVVLLALVAGGIATWLLLRDDGESTREAYCTAVKELAPNDDLIGAISSADTTTLDRAKALPGIAPTSVADDWKAIEDLLTSASQASPELSPTTFLQAYGALQSIIDDSNKNCGTAYELLPSP